MREIDTKLITDTVARLCIEANVNLPCDVADRLCAACKSESNKLAREVLGDLVENFNTARDMNIAICQDTGMAIVFVKLGQDVHLVGGALNDAINEGVRQGYKNGYLRLSVVGDPIERVNTNDNTPAIIYTEIVEGDTVEITVAPKGFGSENMSSIRMFTPSATKEDIMSFVVDTVKKAGGNPCPPIVVGVGIGGDFEYCAMLSKKALCRSLDKPNPNPTYAEMENQLLERINKTDVGPQGFGGDTTALGVNIEQFATHIAGLPVAVNVGCHVTRHKTATL